MESEMLFSSATRGAGVGALTLRGGLAALGALVFYFLSRYNYLLFHGIVVIASVAVAVTLFSIGWNTRAFTRDNTLLVLAIAYLPVAVLDFLHMLSYKGMGVFDGRGADLPTQLWIAARYLESISLLWAATFLGSRRSLRPDVLLALFVAAGVSLYASIIPLGLFPSCYVEGVGLTPFKIASEYLICLLLAAAACVFWSRRRHLDRSLLNLLLASVLVTIVSELSFTLYVDVYGVSNVMGHLFKLLSVLLVYLALVRGALTNPYRTLLRELSSELAQRKASEEQLRTANRELDAFVHTVSHDLRSPLTPIIGYADYLQTNCAERLADEEQAILKNIGQSGRVMDAMMEDLLTLARVGHLEPPAAPVDTGAVVDEILLELGGRLADAGVIPTRGTMPHLRISESLVRQIFSNLVGNALRYGAAGGAVALGGERNGDMVRFYVRDHGPGIPEAERDRIFDLFYRGSTGKRIKGSGIGLAIVQKIGRLYGGRAWVEETPGGGATFWVEVADDGG